MYCHNPYAAASSRAEDDDVMGLPHNSGLSDSGTMTPRNDNPTPIKVIAPKADGITPEEVEEGMGGRRSTSKYYDALSPSLPFHEYGTLHRMLRRDDVDRMGLVRLFVGQVPYHLEAGHVGFIMSLLSGVRPLLVEKIVRWTQGHKPCGCFHVYCRPADVGAMLAADQTALCEADGVWVSHDDVEKQVLVDHCNYLRDFRDARVPLMPYQLMTVQVARSNYRPPTIKQHSAGACAPGW